MNQKENLRPTSDASVPSVFLPDGRLAVCVVGADVDNTIMDLFDSGSGASLKALRDFIRARACVDDPEEIDKLLVDSLCHIPYQLDYVWHDGETALNMFRTMLRFGDHEDAGGLPNTFEHVDQEIIAQWRETKKNNTVLYEHVAEQIHQVQNLGCYTYLWTNTPVDPFMVRLAMALEDGTTEGSDLIQRMDVLVAKKNLSSHDFPLMKVDRVPEAARLKTRLANRIITVANDGRKPSPDTFFKIHKRFLPREWSADIMAAASVYIGDHIGDMRLQKTVGTNVIWQKTGADVGDIPAMLCSQFEPDHPLGRTAVAKCMEEEGIVPDGVMENGWKDLLTLIQPMDIDEWAEAFRDHHGLWPEEYGKSSLKAPAHKPASQDQDIKHSRF